MPAEKALYFIAIVPPEPVLGELLALKEQLSVEYHARAALKSPPHITLHMPFQFRVDRVDKLEAILAKTAHEFSSFELNLKNFDAFPPRVIFVDVEENDALRRLQTEVQNNVRGNLNIFNARYKDRGFHPHLTVLFRDLKKREFERAWEKLSDTSLSYRCRIEDLTLLRHNGSQWETYQTYPLEG